jgi:hypothetical protein
MRKIKQLILKTLIVIIFVELFGFSFALAQKNHSFGVELEGGFSRLLVGNISDTYHTYFSRFSPNGCISLIYESNKNEKFNFISAIKFGSLNDLTFVKKNNQTQIDHKDLNKNRYLFLCPGVKYSVKKFSILMEANIGVFINRIVIRHLGEMNQYIEKSTKQNHYRSGWNFVPTMIEPGINLALGINILESEKLKIGLYSKTSVYLSPNFISNTLALRITSK